MYATFRIFTAYSRSIIYLKYYSVYVLLKIDSDILRLTLLKPKTGSNLLEPLGAGDRVGQLDGDPDILSNSS